MLVSVDDRMKTKAADKALSVTQLLRRMKNLLEVQVGDVWVEGEVSNLRKQGSGHWYFSLKDSGAQISCAMFGASRRPGADVLEDGSKVRVFAEASVYEARGQLQIIVQKVELAGAGDLQAKFEALKRKLQGEGLFDEARKKSIPEFPKTIGLVTSGTGAALQDILNVLKRRAPWVQPVILPVRVQGQGAEREIAAAIGRMGRPDDFGDPVCDVIIVGRGGGSIEDLWNFNEEVVARAIADCPIPIISAVGHEIDFTIADFVADLRAPTPSAAAELAVRDGEELVERTQQLERRMIRQLEDRFSRSALILKSFKRGVLQQDGERLLREPMMRVDSTRSRFSQAMKSAFEDRLRKVKELRMDHRSHHPARVLERRKEALGDLVRRFERSAVELLDQQGEQLNRLRDLLRALGPESAFQRGFSITMNEDGSIVRSVTDVKDGDVIRTKWIDGEQRSRVERAGD